MVELRPKTATPLRDCVLAQRLHKTKTMKLGLRSEEQQTERPRVIAATEPSATTDGLIAFARALRFAAAETLMAQRIAHQRAG